MTNIFLYRTFRNVLLPDRPYFAHLALTHRCNLQCSFCHIQETKFRELDTDGMLRVVDRLDEIGVAVISISGGGEPLIRPDFAEIIDYASFKGIYTKITSNGTMPRRRYEQLLRSRVDEIGISLDGVRRDNLPFSHEGPPILETLRFLNDNLPNGKKLTINVTVTEENREEVDEIVAHCGREYPRARVWLNPVVTGDGALRNAQDKAAPAPDYLWKASGPTLLSAPFYAAGVEQQFRETHRGGRFDWGCRAGRMFFDIKPNGDLWLCQDLPSRTPLNILDPDFERRWKSADFEYRKACSGCTYSCYYLTQRGFEPSNWRDMGLLWWQANTNAGDPCRKAADRYGWVAGLLALIATRVRPLPASATILAVLALATSLLGAAPPTAAEQSDPQEVIACMERRNEERQQRLPAFRSRRIYTAGSSFLRKRASAEVELTYQPPGIKTFRVISRSGTGAIHKRVILPLLETECRNATAGARRATDVHRRNYEFVFREVEAQTGDYVFAVKPLNGGRYLFDGDIWIEPLTCGIRRMRGQPAKSPSFWVKKTEFTHLYELVDGFWLPVTHHTDVRLRIFGGSELDIVYQDYTWLPAEPSLISQSTSNP